VLNDGHTKTISNSWPNTQKQSLITWENPCSTECTHLDLLLVLFSAEVDYILEGYIRYVTVGFGTTSDFVIAIQFFNILSWQFSQSPVKPILGQFCRGDYYVLDSLPQETSWSMPLLQS
jgi:hypothetical protein